MKGVFYRGKMRYLDGKVLTFETLERAYGCTLLVDESPPGKVPRITPVPQKDMVFGPGSREPGAIVVKCREKNKTMKIK